MADLSNLKGLVTTKLALEKQDESFSTEYRDNIENINQFLGGLSANDVKYMQTLCKQDYDKYVHLIANSDIATPQYKTFDAELDVVIACTDLLGKAPVQDQSRGMKR